MVFHMVYRSDTKHYNVWSRGKQLVLFSRESRCFPRLRLGKHRESRENKLTSFPRDQILSALLYIQRMNKLNKRRKINLLSTPEQAPRVSFKTSRHNHATVLGPRFDHVLFLAIDHVQVNVSRSGYI